MLPGTNQLFHPYFVGDAAFPLTNNIIRPFVASLQELTDRQLYFNYRIGRARICVENLFGILVARWGVYHRTIPCRPKTVDKIVKATVVLHNFIKKRKGDSVRYQPEGYSDWVDENDQVIGGTWRKVTPRDILHPIEFDMTPGDKRYKAAVIKNRNILFDYISPPLPEDDLDLDNDLNIILDVCSDGC